MPDVFQEMAESWGSQIVARTHVERFTGGMITPKTLANLDSLGQGPKRIKIGRKTGYPVNEFVSWLRDRATEPGEVIVEH